MLRRDSADSARPTSAAPADSQTIPVLNRLLVSKDGRYIYAANQISGRLDVVDVLVSRNVCQCMDFDDRIDEWYAHPSMNHVFVTWSAGTGKLRIWEVVSAHKKKILQNT
jgi:hypothetical protein